MSNETYASVEEFHEILSHEVYVDIAKLRELSSHGVPSEVRAAVWKYLLGIAVSDMSQEEVNAKDRMERYSALHREYVESIKRIQGEIGRYHQEVDYFKNAEVRKRFENVITAHLTQNPHLRYSPMLVHMCGPLVYVYANHSESDLFYSFQSLLSRLRVDDPRQEDMNRMLGNFINFMRVLLPELHAHFEDEELEVHEWGHSWVFSLLACELPLHCVLRLWDTYFSHHDGLELHPYVCIAILHNYKEDLEEYDHSDLLSFLRHLQPLDMDKIIAQACNIKQEIAASNLV